MLLHGQNEKQCRHRHCAFGQGKGHRKDCENIKVVDNKYNYVGQTEVGSFLLVQRVEDNKYESVYIADADIKFEFV